jgi:chromosome segregation ATPase
MGSMPEETDKNIIKEIITHLNTLEKKINLLNENITETEDLVTVNKLDIVNLKNAIEKMKISMPEVSQDTINRLKELESVTENIGQIGRLKNMENEIESLKSAIRGTKQKGLSDVVAGMEFISQKIEKMESELKDMKRKKHEKAIGSLHKRIETVEKKTSFIKHCPGCHAIVSERAAFCGKCGKKIK